MGDGTRGRVPRGWLRAALLATAVIGCSNAPTPSSSAAAGAGATIGGSVRLPAGTGLDPAKLTIDSPFGSSPVASDGSFRSAVNAGPTFVLASEPGGKLVLCGFLREGATELSARSTAEVLLFYALGAFTVPGDSFAAAVQAVAVSPQAAALSTTLETRLAAVPTLLTDGDADALAAVLRARDEILATSSAAARSARAPANAAAVDVANGPAVVASLAVARGPGGATRVDLGAANVVVSDPGARSGVEVLANPDGNGIVARNDRRRDVELFAYQVASEDANGTRTEIDPPVLAGGPLAVPATRTLNVVFSTLDALSGSGASAWAPVFSQPLDLPLVDGSVRTSYVIVAIGPTADPSDVPALWTESRWFGEVDRWKAAASKLGWRGFIAEHLVSVLTLSIFGSIYQVPTARLQQFEAALRSNAEAVLAKYGVSDPLALRARAKVTAALIEEAGTNASYNRALITEASEIVGQAVPNEQRIAQIQGRFRFLSKAGLILAIVDAVFSVADIGAVAKDLASSSQAESWNVTAVEAAVRLTPSSGLVTPKSPSAEFKVVVNGDPNGLFVYRWSTSGAFGKVSDYLTDGLSVDSHSDKALYLANDPTSITDSLRDTVTVEVFADDGSGTIPAGAKAIGKATATVSGSAEESASPGSGGGRSFWNEVDAWDTVFNRPIHCATLWVAVPYDAAKGDFKIRMYGLDPAKIGFAEQTIQLHQSELEPFPTPRYEGCPGHRYVNGNELWIPLATVETPADDPDPEKVAEITELYQGLKVDFESF